GPIAAACFHFTAWSLRKSGHRPRDTPHLLSRPDPRGRPVTDGARNLVGGFLDQRAPLHLHAVGGRGERARRYQCSAVIPHAGGDVANADLGLLGIVCSALAVAALDAALEPAAVRDRAPGV